MTGDAERVRTALHEAGHHVVAAVYGWRLGAVTITSGTALAGCSIATPPLVAVPANVDYAEPFIRWPSAVRRRIEGESLVYLSGDAAEMLFVPRSGRRPDPVSVQAAEAIAEPDRPVDLSRLPAATAKEHADVAVVCADPAVPSDADRVARLARYAHDGDVAGAGAWIFYMETQARVLLLAHEQRVRRLADALLATGTVGAEAAARLLA